MADAETSESATDFAEARARGDARLGGPRAVAARYGAGRGRVVITLSTGIELGLLPRDVEGLAGASAEQLRAIEIKVAGLGIHFPRLDADLSLPALLDGVLGSRRWMAARETAHVRSAAARPGGRARRAASAGE